MTASGHIQNEQFGVAVTVQIHTGELPALHQGWVTCYPDGKFLLSPSILPGKFWDSY
jgi:hypothetical protein